MAWQGTDQDEADALAASHAAVGRSTAAGGGRNPPWTFLPQAVYDEDERRKKADEWVARHRGELAQRWRDLHAQDAADLLRQHGLDEMGMPLGTPVAPPPDEGAAPPERASSAASGAPSFADVMQKATLPGEEPIAAKALGEGDPSAIDTTPDYGADLARTFGDALKGAAPATVDQARRQGEEQGSNPDLPGLPWNTAGPRVLPYQPPKPTRDPMIEEKVGAGEPLTGEDFAQGLIKATSQQYQMTPAAIDGLPGVRLGTSEEEAGRAFARGAGGSGPSGVGGMVRAAGDVAGESGGLLESAQRRPWTVAEVRLPHDPEPTPGWVSGDLAITRTPDGYSVHLPGGHQVDGLATLDDARRYADQLHGADLSTPESIAAATGRAADSFAQEGADATRRTPTGPEALPGLPPGGAPSLTADPTRAGGTGALADVDPALAGRTDAPGLPAAAEAGRALEAAPAVDRALGADPVTLAKGAEAAAGQGGQRANWLRSYYYFALLSGPVTHARNAVGNAGMLAGEMATRPLSVAVDQVLSLAPGREKAMSWNEVPAEAVGAAVGLRVGWRNAIAAFGDPETAAAVASKLETQAYRSPAKRTAGAIGQVAGTTVTMPGRLLNAADQFFRGVNSQSIVWGEAARQVAKMDGYKGRPIADPEVWRKIADLAANPTPEMATRVEKRTAERVFQTEPDALIQGVTKVRDKLGPAGWLVVPFVNTPYNVWKAAVSHAIGVDPSRFRDLKDPVQQAETLARLGVATGLGVTAWSLASQDRLTGAAPSGADRDEWLKTHQEYSVRVGDGTWVSYKDVAPQYAPLLAGVANAQQASRYAKKPQDAAVAGLGGALQAFLRLPFVPEPVNDAIGDLLDGDSVTLRRLAGNAQRAAVRPLESMANPSIVRFGQRVEEQAAGAPYARETRQDLVGGAVDRVKANTPGLETDLPIRYDVLGAPTRRQAGETLSPVGVSDRPADPVIEELDRLRTTRGETGETIGRSLTRLPRTIRGRTLDPDEYDDLQRLAGERIRRALEERINSSAYQRTSDEIKAKALAQIIAAQRERATIEVLGRPPKKPTRRR